MQDWFYSTGFGTQLSNFSYSFTYKALHLHAPVNNCFEWFDECVFVQVPGHRARESPGAWSYAGHRARDSPGAWSYGTGCLVG